MTLKRRLLIATALICCSAQSVLADPPARVGRLSFVDGTVSFHPADQDQWSYATLNYPVTSGDGFWTEPDAKSEIQAGSVAIRMDQMTNLDILQLDDSATRIEVPQGAVNVHVDAPPPGGSVQVVTPVGEIDLTQPGTYHIDSGQPSGDTPSNQVQVTTLEGNVQIHGPRSMLEVMPGETATMTGNPPTFSLAEGNATPFDDWALSREPRIAQRAPQQAPQQEAPPPGYPQPGEPGYGEGPYGQPPAQGAPGQYGYGAPQYVSPQMTGYQDLAAYGQWAPDPTYGNVWYPTEVAADWAPYRYGHWAFVAPWGWTWVDDAPWGFAPFHYGRWIQEGPRWGWVPGAVVARPVYAPALVAFIGGISIGISDEPVGWVPLGPREVFHPYYHVSNNYIRNVNVAYVDRRTLGHIDTAHSNHFMNQHAATVVPANSFTHGENVRNAHISVPAEQLSHASFTPSLSHLQPQGNALVGGRALSSSARAELPRPNVQSNVTHQASGNAPISHMQQVQPSQQHAQEQMQEHTVQNQGVPHPTGLTPGAQRAVQHPEVNAREQAERASPMVQNFSSAHPHQEEEAPHPANYRQGVQRSVPMPRTNANVAHEAETPRAAPGPQVRHPTAIERNQSFQNVSRQQRQQNLPHADVPHPQQQTRIAPTQQGWKRQEAPQQHQAQGHESNQDQGRDHH